LRERERERERERVKKLGYKLFKVSFWGRGWRGEESARPSLQDLNNGLVTHHSCTLLKQKKRGEERGERRGEWAYTYIVLNFKSV
jgi:hypothetical protein